MDYSDIRRLIGALFNPGACFMIGAGVPEKLIPITNNFKDNIGVKNQVGIYDTMPNKTHQIHEVLVGEDTDGLKSHITLPTARLVALSYINDCRIKAEKSDVIPSEYAIFKYLPISSVIVDFNLDGFAKHWCPQRCIYPHGCIEGYRPMLNGNTTSELIDIYQDYNYQDERAFPNCIIFEEESKNYQHSFEYDSLSRVLQICSAL